MCALPPLPSFGVSATVLLTRSYLVSMFWIVKEKEKWLWGKPVLINPKLSYQSCHVLWLIAQLLPEGIILLSIAGCAKKAFTGQPSLLKTSGFGLTHIFWFSVRELKLLSRLSYEWFGLLFPTPLVSHVHIVARPCRGSRFFLTFFYLIVISSVSVSRSASHDFCTYRGPITGWLPSATTSWNRTVFLVSFSRSNVNSMISLSLSKLGLFQLPHHTIYIGIVNSALH